jgi:hypothetical protein
MIKKSTFGTYPKLPKDFKKKWLVALRSGKYLQSKSALKEKDSAGKSHYCCLGVAGEIVGAKCMLNKALFTKEDRIRGVTKVPAMLRGDTGANPLVKKLVSINTRYKFPGVADWIEENL